MSLRALGWTDDREAAFVPHAARGLEPARVVVAYGATFRVATKAGDSLADVSGRLRHAAAVRRDLPAVGDWVALQRATAEGGRATIQAILPRTSLFSRKVAGGETAEQVLAANVDTAFLVTGLDHDFNPRRMERYLAMTWDSGASPVILLNKMDVAQDVAAQVWDIEQVAVGMPVHAISSKQGRGLEALAPYLQPGRTIVVLGSSGVGKSTLINRLLGVDRLRTRAVREADSRGRHTTTHRELVVLPGGALLIDTPGMRELQLWSEGAGIDEAFDDIRGMGEACYFRNCRHQTEPRCAVKAAVEAGTLPAARLANYHKLLAELAALEARQTALGQQDRKRSDRAGARALRTRVKEKKGS